MTEAAGVPEGWSLNPSLRARRGITALIACIGLIMACYLAGFQLHLWHHIWDPFFKDGSERVLTSRVSEAFPIPDALLGALAYLAEIVLLLLGDDERWRTAPRLTILSSLMSLALGAASLTLLVLQPVAVHAWCTPCLIAAATLLVVLQRSLVEPAAALQHLLGLPVPADCERDGDSYHEPGSPPADEPPGPVAQRSGGISAAGNLLVCVPLGAVTLALPDLLDIQGVARLSIVLAGTLTLAGSIVAMAELARPVRFVIGFAGFLLFSYFLGEPLLEGRWLCAGIGTALMGLCFFRRGVHHRYGAFMPF